MRNWRTAGGCLLILGVLLGCDREEDVTAPPIRPVRVATAIEREASEVVSLSGVVEAKTEADLGFRIGGRLLERLVNVGDTVQAGQIIARLDAEDEENAFRAAQAELVAAEGRMIEAEANYERQRQLLDRGFTTRQRYDESAQILRTLRSQVDAAQAQLGIARRRLDDTVLYADATGAVTVRGAEPGEVVQAGQMVVRIARDGGRDAVFDAPADLLARGSADTPIEVSLSIDPAIVATGRVREVSPQADPVTGAFRVRVGLDQPPGEMRLGSTVTGRIQVEREGGVTVPASALGRVEGQPAIWIFDPESETVEPRPVQVLAHRPSEVILAGGLAPGELVVTAGVQTLRPGEKVRLPGSV